MTAFKVVPIAKPDPEVLELLQQLTEQAQAGGVRTGYTPVRDAYVTIGQLERMKFLLFQSVQSEPV